MSGHLKTEMTGSLNSRCALRVLHLLYKEPECSEDVPERGGGLVDLEKEQVGVQHLLHQ